MMSNQISKTINYCWFGGNKKSKLIKKCISSWSKQCPDYKIVEWNEKNVNLDENCYIREAYNAKKWAFVADYIRLKVIYEYGGIYLDTDVELIKNIDDLLEKEAFFSIEPSGFINTGLGFGAKKGNKIVKKMLDGYNGIHFMGEDGEMDLTPCPVRNTESISECEIGNEVTLLKSEYFSPYDPQTGTMNITTKTYGIHWYNASWRDGRINIKRKILRPLKRILGKERFEYIKGKIRKSK